MIRPKEEDARSTPQSQARPQQSRDWLVGGGEMGKVLRSMDWSKTPLGPIDGWPQSLRTTVSLCLASNFPISIAWGPHHVQIYNDGYWPICGEKHPSSMGQDFSECWASAWPAIGDAFERALSGQTSYLENIRMFLDRNGYLEETFFTFSFSPIRDESGGVGGLFHPVTEVTARMLSERRTRALRDLAARTIKAETKDAACTAAAQVLSEFDLDLPFVLVYRADEGDVSARLSACAGAVAGQSLAPVSVDLGPGASWPIAEVIDSGQTIQVDALEQRFGGFIAGPYAEAPKAALLLPLRAAGVEKPLGVVVLGTSARLPLTEPYRGYCELLASTVGTAFSNAHAREQERMRVEALAEIDRAKTEFFSNVSHEFRTPLTLMLAPLEDELAEAAASGERRERLETAHRNALRLLKMVNTLLDFSRIEAGRTQANFEPTDLATATADLASVFRSAFDKAGVRFGVHCPPLSDPVFVDRDMWEKIVLNLLSNAYKHTFEGQVSLTLAESSGHVELTVADTGVGVPAAELPRLFERFHRVKGSRSRSHEGTGIGLALVSELSAQHGGGVTATSAMGVGTTFTVRIKKGSAHLPPERVQSVTSLAPTSIAAAAYVEEALHWNASAETRRSSPPASASAKPDTSPPVRRPVVLWADDNQDMRAYVERLLSSSYDVISVPNGARALEAALEEPPDLVLTDVMMPELDGFGLLSELRKHPSTRMIPVIVLSARAGEEAAVEGLVAGADDYLAKPFSARELLARVKTHIEMARMRRERARELQLANDELEAFSHSVSHDLRAPLRAIDGFSRLVMTRHASGLDAEGLNYLERIRAATGRMSELIDDLLELSRVSRVPVRREPVALSELAEEVAAELRKVAASRVVGVEVEKDLEVRGDSRLLRLVLQNLLGNAFKFTAKRHAAQISVGRVRLGKETAYFVRDDGAGFDMNYVDKLFQPFSRLHRQSEFEGTGIGLATVQRIVRRHGGRVWAESTIGEGATFYFTLAETA